MTIDSITHINRPMQVNKMSFEPVGEYPKNCRPSALLGCLNVNVYIPVENHTKIQLKTIPLIDAYLHSFFTNEGRIKNDKNEYETEDYSSQVPGWLFRT
jgi:hypothetical protein